MNNAKDLSRAERLEIGILLRKGYSLRSIARELGRSPNTVSQEIKKNRTKGTYDPLKADAKSRLRKRMRRFQWKKIEHDRELKAYIIEKLKLRWNPDEIAGRMKKERLPFHASKTAIYEWLRSPRGLPYCRYLYSKRMTVKRRKPKAVRSMIPNRIGLEQRPKGATNRTRYGHWEADTVVSGKRGKGALSVAVERKSRYVTAGKLATMRPGEHAEVFRRALKGAKSLSVTLDNGIENKEHERMGTPAFFCDPHCAWQKGSVENANKMLRQYFPKGTNFARVSQKDVDAAVSLINGKPRRILGYATALEAAAAGGIIGSITKSECPN